MKRKLTYLTLLLLLLAGVANAQQNVYECDFEDANERSQWTLNPATPQQSAKIKNKWYFGQVANFSATGQHGLLISTSNGAVADYDASETMFVSAERMMPATLAAGNYNLYFDYMCAGKDGAEGFYICWVPVSQNVNGATAIGGLPQWVKDYRTDSIPFHLHGSWTCGKTTIQHDGTPRKLVIVWFSTKGTAIFPAAQIDNLELSLQNDCAAVTKVSHTIVGDSVILKWNGSADYYEVKNYDMDNNVWQVFPYVTQATCTIPNLAEGVQSFIIRAHCGNLASDYVEYVRLVYHKGVRCIDYMELTNQNCKVGPYSNPFSIAGKVDSGYASPKSHHTLHYMPGERDARSNYQLLTRPEGYLASVRLGNYDSGNGSGEAVEYKYKVQSGATSILKIKYAAVLSNPHPDNPAINPRFWLDVLHNGRQISNQCGYAFFTSGDSEESGWREGASGWLWKDWTEQSINLRDFEGETLTIRLVTTDCEPGAHTGYAYFVLDCESGELSDLNCGENNPTTHFAAPDGFDYVWYRPNNPYDTLATTQDFTIGPMDTVTYSVNIINKNNRHCWYTLNVSGRPRIPAPSASYSVSADHCSNVVVFTNTSHVDRQDVFNDSIITTDEKVTSLLWDFGDGTQVSSLQDQVSHVYPKEGGHYVLRLTAGVSNDACLVSRDIPIDLPNLTLPTTQIDLHACRTDYPYGYTYQGANYYTSVDSTYVLESKVTGCDSLVRFRLTFHENTPYQVADTICEGDTLHFFGQLLTQSGEYDGKGVNAWGCDSIAHMKLHMEPRLRVAVSDTIHICPEDNFLEIPYTLVSGRMQSVTVLPDMSMQQLGFEPSYTFPLGEPVQIPMPAGSLPNRYRLTLHYDSESCHVEDRHITAEVNYSSSIIWQKGGVLILKNAEYNGGYDFVSYQWYRDGEPIPGATEPNLQVTDADQGHEYHVVVTRGGDNLTLETCSIVFGATGLDEVQWNQMEGALRVYSLTGVLLRVMQSSDEFIQLPQGVYLITDGRHAIKVVR